MKRLYDLLNEMERLSNQSQAANLARFFKTGAGEYGEGDVFLGIKVPVQRQLARKYRDMPLVDVGRLLESPIHEHRLTALLILDSQYKAATKADGKEVIHKREGLNPNRRLDVSSSGKYPLAKSTAEEIVRFYLSHLDRVNNWDLVDLSAPRILGEHLLTHPREKVILLKLAASDNLWKRRVAIVATYAMIRKGMFKDTMNLAGLLLDDKHDLIQKAVGWMLREVGKRNQPIEEAFLKKHRRRMPRTMLRYAIERFSDGRKKFYMNRYI